VSRLVAALLLAGVACSGSSDAPRPIGPTPIIDDSPDSVDIGHRQDDDDGDGIQNDHDNCPLAREDWDDPVRDGCPDGGVDAGAAPIGPGPR
jgi:hypothetical protein